MDKDYYNEPLFCKILNYISTICMLLALIILIISFFIDLPKLIIPILLIIGLLINVIPNIYKKNMGIVVNVTVVRDNYIVFYIHEHNTPG